ncbi:tetratricopeptide repeat protein [uncultured Selenomonas sp.]|uniref:tetratricopeptide repeat protein n=1 Tax=uncultured Selenomonas sp. TaxID=159275 RepID=UPI00258F7822|nr:tetratricopeptide repeat protein [uncultured Selenomonas sp.]
MAGQAEVFAEKIKQQMAAADYGGALETLAASISAEVYDAGCMYEGACAYFMLGDYTRAAQWVQNTLQYAPDHAAARLLLARICILEDRVEDGLAIFEFVLAHEAAQLTQQQREDMEDILAYYGRSEASLVRKYPHVAAFLHVEAEEDAETVDGAPSAAAALAAEAGEAPALTAKETENVPATQPVAEAGSAAQPAAEEMPEASERTKAAPEAADTAAAEHQLTDILASQAGVAQKVHMLNAFAGGFFVARAYGLAQRYLNEALQLDTASAETLRNLAVLAHVQGDDDRALKFASALPETDFLLLASLRG